MQSRSSDARRRGSLARSTHRAATDWIRMHIPLEFCSIGFDWLWIFGVLLCLPQNNGVEIFYLSIFAETEGCVDQERRSYHKAPCSLLLCCVVVPINKKLPQN